MQFRNGKMYIPTDKRFLYPSNGVRIFRVESDFNLD
mgnify:CR=1 FL=1